VTSTNPTAISPHAWEESTGLLSQLIPKTNGSTSTTTATSASAFNALKTDLKLGTAPMSEDLRGEAERVLREQAMVDRDPNVHLDLQLLRPQPFPGVIAPAEADMLPYPPAFKTVDVEREVNAVRDARKRIRLDPSALNGVDPNSLQTSTLRARALPSICAYTLHDVPEGWVFIPVLCFDLDRTDFGERAPCCTFSMDTSLMAVGFAESYIRLWSLKGEKLRALRNDLSATNIKDSQSSSWFLLNTT
jgi:transcription initiation factor TFIID subunit 5